MKQKQFSNLYQVESCFGYKALDLKYIILKKTSSQLFFRITYNNFISNNLKVMRHVVSIWSLVPKCKPWNLQAKSPFKKISVG